MSDLRLGGEVVNLIWLGAPYQVEHENSICDISKVKDEASFGLILHSLQGRQIDGVLTANAMNFFVTNIVGMLFEQKLGRHVEAILACNSSYDSNLYWFMIPLFL